MKSIWLPAVAILILLSAASMHAQNGSVDGCDDSPENPTAILAVAGTAGAGLARLVSAKRAKK